ncbi:site-specific integrase [Catenulispora rubra]|uniref:site-specific integrase n=1 Tax=Catenulispora rubra TaxID=280293 RepID=UPI001891FC9A|nr:site-specific integrase [Catenulispora rubra]
MLRSRAALPDVDRVRERLRRGLTPTVSLWVGQWLTMWLAERTDLRPATRLDYSGLIARHLLPALGDIPLEELRPEQVRAVLAGVGAEAREIRAASQRRRAVIDTARAAWRAHDSAAARAARQQLAALPPFRRPAGASTVQQVRAVLRSALSEAVRRELVTVIVAKLVRLPAPPRARPLEWTPSRVAAWRKTGRRPLPVMAWTPAQTSAFLGCVAGHRLRALFTLLAYTDCRRGEACGLHWIDVDFRRREAAVSTQLCRIGTETVEGPPKTDAGVRTLALAKVLHAALVAQRNAQRVERRAAGVAWIDTGRVFAKPDGSELNPAEVSDVFDRLVRDKGLPPIRLHDLKHGAATDALDAGVPVKVVSDMLGHSSTTVTLDLYATDTDRSRHAAADAIAHRLEG